MSKQYDVAAYIWPSYHRDPRSLIFWPEGMGEWQTVKANKPKFEGHLQNRQPLWGYVNEADPYVMQMEIDAAYDHGVNVFIYDWYWYDRHPFLEGCLNNGYLKAPNNDKVKFYIMWANHNVNHTWDKRLAGKTELMRWTGEDLIWYASVDRHEFEIIGKRIINQYFSHPSYYHIDGKPCFMIYDLDMLTQGLGGVEETKRALDWFQNEAIKAGHKGIHFQVCLRKHLNFDVTGVDGQVLGSQQDVIESLGINGTTHYQFCHLGYAQGDYMDIVPKMVEEWELLGKDYSIPYFPHVSIGWDNNPRYEGLRPDIITNNGPENFKKALEYAKDYVDRHPNQAPLITINSWNEWTETSYLQPDTLYGYGYLDAVRDVFKK